MSTQNLFDDSVTKYRSVYFHFLDGLLNKEAGGEFNYVLSTLKNIANFDFSQISFLEINYYDNKSSNLNVIKPPVKLEPVSDPKKLLNTSAPIFVPRESMNTSAPIFVPRESMNASVAESLHETLVFDYISDVNDLNIIKVFMLNYFKFCIIPIGFNQHQTTTIIFINERTSIMYLYILNTGLDIQENGPEKEINEQKLSQLCTGIILCNNINDDKKIIQAYDILKNFMFLNFFYNYIKTNKYSKKIQSNPDKYTFDDNFFYFLSIFNGFHNIKFILNGNKITIEELLSIQEFKNPNKKFLDIYSRYYPMISNFLKQQNIIQIGDDIDIKKYNNLNIELIKTNDKLSENFLKKIILYNHDNNLYIYPQESGSCTWYSTYFSILIYYVIKGDFDQYIFFINNINKKFYEYLITIYTTDEYNKQLLMYDKPNDPDTYKNYLYMKKLGSKLYDIKILDNVLYDQQDFIYKVDFNLENFEDSNSDIRLVIKETIDIDSDNITFLQKFLDNINEIRLYNIAYDIYSDRGRKFFSDVINKDIIIQNFNSFLDINKQKINRENIVITNNLIKSIIHDIESFNVINSFSKDNAPSYIFYFIPIIIHLNSIKKNMELNLEDKIDDLFDCCKIFYKFTLFYRIIINCYMIHIKNIQLYIDQQKLTELFNILILPLIVVHDKIISSSNKKTRINNNLSLINDLNVYGIFNSNKLEEEKDEKENEKNLLSFFYTNINIYKHLEQYIENDIENISPIYIYLNINSINTRTDLKNKLLKLRVLSNCVSVHLSYILSSRPIFIFDNVYINFLCFLDYYL